VYHFCIFKDFEPKYSTVYQFSIFVYLEFIRGIVHLCRI